jgi:hypothetical protein
LYKSKRKFLSEESAIEISKKYGSGQYTIRQLCEEYNVSNRKIDRVLKIFNVDIIPQKIRVRKHQVNEDYFEVIDDEYKAYILGFLYADGGNFTKGGVVYILIQYGDINILEKISNCLDSKYPIKKTINASGGEMCFLRITSRKMSNDLNKIGCTDRKSLTLTFPNEDILPKELQKHFIRGHFDGDGCLKHYYRYDKNKGYKWSAWKFTIASTYQFGNSVGQILKETVNINYQMYPHYNIYSMEVSGNKQIYKCTDWLYRDSNIYLDRKYQEYSRLNLYIEGRYPNGLDCPLSRVTSSN